MEAFWKCMVKGCDYTAPPTQKGYKQVLGHMLGHASKGLPKEERVYALVDGDTGNVLANTIGEAIEKGLLAEAEAEVVVVGKKLPKIEKGKVEKSGEEAEKEDETEAGESEMIITGGVFHYTITLPADAFMLFNIAKGYGLEKGGKLFDEWVFDCITKRFEKDYKMQLILAPLEEA